MSPAIQHLFHLTVQSGVHTANIDQQTDHGHADSSALIFLLQQLLLKDLTALAAPGHGVDVNLGEGVSFRAIAEFGEALGLVVEDELEEIILNIFAPERDAVFFLEVSDLVARIDGRCSPILVVADRSCGGSVEGLVSVVCLSSVAAFGCRDSVVVFVEVVGFALGGHGRRGS